MELSNFQKIGLGILSAWPFVYIFIFMAFILGMIALSAGGPGGGDQLSPLFGGGFVLLFLVHIVTIFLSLGLTVFYIVHAIKNVTLDNNMRIVWIILFFFGGVIAQPIYWYLQVWKKPKVDLAQLAPPPAGSWAETPDVNATSPGGPPDWRQ